MRVRRLCLLAFVSVLFPSQPIQSQDFYSLDSCRTLAVRNNKQLRIRDVTIESAGYQRDQAFAAYLPSLDFAGGYAYNQRNLSIFDSDQLLPVKNFDLATGKYEFALVKNPQTGEPIVDPKTGEPVPESVALIPKDAMTFDVHNVFFGAVTLTQPIYMGGKIVALNKISGYAEDLARQMRDSEAENVIYAVDAAYWQVVSLRAKEKLALSYVALLDTLNFNVRAMIEEGVATPNDLLQVEVRQNSAAVDLVKVQDGLKLSRMALAQLCGLPVDTPMTLLEEEDGLRSGRYVLPDMNYNMEEVFSRRHDLNALELGINIRREQANVARAAMLPNLALVGTYSFSNPNMYDGFKRRFGGAFSVGAMLTVPLWHWGGNYNAYRASRSQITIAQLQLEDARELVTLQVNQATFRCKEALRTQEMTVTNINAATENLRQATLGFREGVMTLTTVMEAQTAWLKANSEKIDAEIDLRLCNVYLSKVLGNLNY